MKRVSTVLAIALCVTGAQAQTPPGIAPDMPGIVLDKSGAWTTALVKHKGKAYCISRQELGDNKAFSLIQSEGEAWLTAFAKSPGWTAPLGQKVTVRFAIDGRQWEGRAPSLGRGVGAAVAFPTGPEAAFFLENFRLGRQMTVSFPGTREPAWSVSLSGSDKTVTAFSACSLPLMEDLERRARGLIIL